MERGRPSSYQPEYAEQARKLCLLGATDQEIADFFDREFSEDDWLAYCLEIIREDRRGVIAHRKKVKREKSALRRSCPQVRMVDSMRARLWAAVKGKTNGRLIGRLPYTAADLVSHLSSMLAPGMTMENYGAWHIDHKKPCAKFDQTDPKQFEECWALSNLQPLWATDNCKKGASYVPA